MNRLAFRRPTGLALTMVALLVFTAAILASASSTKTTSSTKPAAVKPAAPAATKPASTNAGHSTTGASGTHTGTSTSGHTGPTTGNPSGHAGPTTSNPSGRGGPTTGNPAGRTTTTTGGAGGRAPVTAGNPSGHLTPAGSRTMPTRDGAVTKRANGKIADVHDTAHGMDVHHGLNGSRRVSVDRPDHSHIMAERGRPGYVERRYSFHGHEYGRRAYYWHGHEYNRFYRGYYYHGVYLGVYAPPFYFAPGFYGWAYNPWAAPVVYGWGWGANPWYGSYGFYFAPSPFYASPADWLADYTISTTLAAGYAAQQEAGTEGVTAPNTGQPMITPEIKQQIADEVRAQIALENSEAQGNQQGQEPDPASSSINRMFSDGKPHVFIASSSMDVVDAGGAECALSDGDVLRLSAPPAAAATNAGVSVVVSKGGKECRQGATVMIALADLQEMQNGIRATVDQGMQELKTNQGKGGIPPAPASAMASTSPSAFTQDAPPPEVNGATEVNAQLKVADQVDLDASQTTPIGALDTSTSSAEPAAGTINIAIGQTIGQVTAALGQPTKLIDLGAKKIYVYKDMKVVFQAGKVSDVQ
jgi:hypothetical protein